MRFTSLNCVLFFIATFISLLEAALIKQTNSLITPHVAVCASTSRRSFMFNAVRGIGVSLIVAGEQADASDANVCRPPRYLSKKLSDTRAQIDMAVQASSVQAFSAAAEIANDPLLDSDSLRALLLESCGEKNSSPFLDISVVEGALLSVENMRSKLNSQNILTTKDVKDIMQYGTAARSGIDSIFDF